MRKIFILYRRHGDTTAGYAAEIHSFLESKLGPDTVFRDLDSLSPGVRWRDKIEEALAECVLALVLVGRHFNPLGEDGQPRLNDPTDVLRFEIARALELDHVAVLPVLFDVDRWPPVVPFPPEIADLGECQYARWYVQEKEDFELQRLWASIQRADPRTKTVWPPPRTDRGKSEDPSERLAILLERAVRKGVVPAGAAVAVAQYEPPRESASARKDKPTTRARRDLGRQQAQNESQTPRRRAEVEGRAAADWPQAMVPPPAPPHSMAPSPTSPKPAATPGSVSPGRAHHAPRVWVTLGAAAAVVAVLYELARQVFGSLLFTAELSPFAGREENGDLVDCTVFAPSSAAPGESLLIQVFAHLAEQTDDARALATEFDPGTQRRAFRSLEAPVPPGAVLTFELHVPGADVAQPIETMTWQGRAQSVQFEVALPPDLTGSLFGTIWISRDGGPLGHVKFKLGVRPDARPAEPLPVGDAAVRYTAAFISYAALDRNEVLRRVQILQALKIHHFQDLLELEPGDQWWPRLQSAIDECDLFLLFWSSRAKSSKWVRKEVLHALSRQAGDHLSPPEIRLVILEGPPLVPPWDELSHLHFNDKLLYFMSPQTTAE